MAAALVVVLGTCLLAPALARPVYVPVSAAFNGDVLMFQLQKVDMLLRSEDPNLYPMFQDLPKTGALKAVTVEELEEHLDATDATRGAGLFESDSSQVSLPYANPVPKGFIFHEARVGSTLGANS